MLTVTRDGKTVTELLPSKRQFTVERTDTTEAGIHASWAGDLYAVLGDPLKDGAYSIRLYFNPLVRLIWIGALVMFFGGAVSLSDRRLRVGAPKRGRGQVAPAAAASERMSWRSVVAALCLALGSLVLRGPHTSRPGDEVLADPALEARARDISAGLRCLVCQNQSIDDSDAPLAKDLQIARAREAESRRQRWRGRRLRRGALR